MNIIRGGGGCGGENEVLENLKLRWDSKLFTLIKFYYFKENFKVLSASITRTTGRLQKFTVL